MIQHLEINDENKQKLLETLMKKEGIISSGLHEGVAVPHIKTELIENITCLLAISQKGIDFEAIDSKPVFIVFLIIYPEKEEELGESLAESAGLFYRQGALQSLRSTKKPAEVINILQRAGKHIG